MSNLFFVGDTHFWHEAIYSKYHCRPMFDSIEDHNEFLIDRWNDTVGKNDVVYHVGDVSFCRYDAEQGLSPIARLNGRKILIRGNHDEYPIQEYLKYFEEVYGVHRKKKMWITHVPIHPNEFYRCVCNIHGHLHEKVLDDPRYINVSVEQNDFRPTSLDQIRQMIKDRGLAKDIDPRYL